MNPRVLVVLALVVVVLGLLVAWALDTPAAQPEASQPAPRPLAGGRVIRDMELRSEPRDAPPPAPAPVTPRPSGEALVQAPVDAGAAQDPGADADGGAGALTDAEIRARLALNAKRAAAEIDRFCEQSEKLKKTPLFPDSPRRNDAAVFFASRVDWEGSPPRFGSLRPAAPLREKIKAAEGNWPVVLTDADLVGLDFSWMKQALVYDVWTLEGDGAADEAHVTAMWSSIPNYISLMQWAKLRYRKAIRDGDWADAVLEVRHLAALIHSQEIAVGEAVAMVLLRYELRARAHAATLGVDLSALPPPPDLATINTAHPLVISSGWFTAPGVDPEVRRRALKCSSFPCVTAVEGLSLHSSLRTFAPSGSVERYLDDVRSLGCNTNSYDRLARRPPATLQEITELLSVVTEDKPLVPAAK